MPPATEYSRTSLAFGKADPQLVDFDQRCVLEPVSLDCQNDEGLKKVRMATEDEKELFLYFLGERRYL